MNKATAKLGTDTRSVLKYEHLLVSPAMASEFRRQNSNNRPLRKRKISQYAADMVADRWKDTGQPLIFGKSGRMLDGQHRCQAIIEAGTSVWMWVVRGVEDSTFTYIDDGAPRTLADILLTEGWNSWDARTGATAIRYAIAFSAGGMKLNLPCANHAGREFLFEHPELMSSVELLSRLPRQPSPLPHSLGAFLHYEFVKRDREQADIFIRQLWTGENLPSDTLLLQLRNRLLSRRFTGDSRGVEYLSAAVMRVWNSLRRGKPIRHINNAFRSDGGRVELE